VVGDVELPPDPQLRTDLLAIRRRASSGSVSIVLPRQANGRHCDHAAALALSLAWPISEPEQQGPAPGTPEAAEAEARARKAARQAEQRRQLERRPWRRY
jgi:hypothetical protein